MLLTKDNFAHRAAEWDSPEKIKMTDIFVTEMLKHVQPKKTWKALEVGAGTGLVGLKILEQVNSVVFEDTSDAMLEVLRQKLNQQSTFEIVLGEVFQYSKQDIDFVFSCMAFHHIPDVDLAIKHLFEITNENAIVVVGDIRTEDGSFHRFEPIPHKGFDTKILAEKFVNAGFQYISSHTYNVLSRERTEGVNSEYEQFMLIVKK